MRARGHFLAMLFLCGIFCVFITVTESGSYEEFRRAEASDLREISKIPSDPTIAFRSPDCSLSDGVWEIFGTSHSSVELYFRQFPSELISSVILRR